MREELSEEDDARIRALLAETATAGDDALPPDVAQRLDDRLAELVDARADTRAAVRRTARRRWLMVAASAAVVVGIGVPVARSIGSGDGATNTATSGSATSGSQDSAASPAPSASSDAGGRAEKNSADARLPGAYGAEVPRLTSVGFRTQARRLLRSVDDLSASQAQPGPTRSCAGTSGRRTTRADVTQRIAIRFDGRPAVLEVHRADRSDRLVEAVSCDGQVLARTRLR